jgi:hypothetical protein
MGQVAELRKPAEQWEGPISIPKLVNTQVLADFWDVPVSWIQHGTRSSCCDPIPHIKIGRYVRFDLSSPALAAWLVRRQAGAVR